MNDTVEVAFMITLASPGG